MNKLTLEQAKEIAERLKEMFKFGTQKCPKWFSNTSIAMCQDGSYIVEICIPDWSAMNDEEKNFFLEPFQGTHIYLRVVRPAQKYDFAKQDREAEEKKKAKAQKKKRRSHREGYR